MAAILRTVPILFMRPDRLIREDGTVVTRTQDEIAYARDLAQRFAGLISWATDGKVRFDAYEANPGIPYDYRREQWDPSTIFGGAIHVGAADAYRKLFDADAYSFRVFLGAPSFFQRPGEFGLSWGGSDDWVYVNAAPPANYAGKTQTLPFDVVVHETLHQVEAQLADRGITIPSPDRAGDYGFRATTRGWMDFLSAVWDGRLAKATDGPGVSDDRKRLILNRGPGSLERVTRLPFVTVTNIDAPWVPRVGVASTPVDPYRKPSPVTTSSPRPPRR